MEGAHLRALPIFLLNPTTLSSLIQNSPTFDAMSINMSIDIQPSPYDVPTETEFYTALERKVKSNLRSLVS